MMSTDEVRPPPEWTASVTAEMLGVARKILDNDEYEDWTFPLACCLASACAAIESRDATIESLRSREAAWLAAMPKCVGKWLDGSGGHVRFSQDCERAATWSDDGLSNQPWRFCDEHAPERLKNSGSQDEIVELPHAALVRTAK
jgi:hypothetical protein